MDFASYSQRCWHLGVSSRGAERGKRRTWFPPAATSQAPSTRSRLRAPSPLAGRVATVLGPGRTRDASLENCVHGFQFPEGPVWTKRAGFSMQRRLSLRTEQSRPSSPDGRGDGIAIGDPDGHFNSTTGCRDASVVRAMIAGPRWKYEVLADSMTARSKQSNDVV